MFGNNRFRIMIGKAHTCLLLDLPERLSKSNEKTVFKKIEHIFQSKSLFCNDVSLIGINYGF